MRIGELSRTTGVAIPTIKYYQREGLLPAGTATGPNQADYTEAHQRRLRLIRALLEVGNLSIAGARDVLRTVDDPEASGHALLGVAHRAVSPAPRLSRSSPEWQAAQAEAAELVKRQGWQVEADAPGVAALADGIAALRALGHTEFLLRIDEYAGMAATLARLDLELVLSQAPEGRGGLVEAVVVGTVLGEGLFAALRRLAQEDASFAATGGRSGPAIP